MYMCTNFGAFITKCTIVINFMLCRTTIMDVRDHGILIRSRAIGMLEGGTMQKEVAQC